MKSGQIQGGETIAVMIIIVIIIIIGLIFGFGRSAEKIDEDSQKIDYLDSVRIALKATNLQELKCTKANSGGNTCLDKYKIQSLAELINESTEAYVIYQSIFENTKITIKTIYSEETQLTLYNYNDSTNSSRPIYMPILLWDPIENTKQFGLMEVRTYN